MRILFCSQTRMVKQLGGSKPLLELAEEMEQLGWQCDFLSPFDLAPEGEDPASTIQQYAPRLRAYLQQQAAQYDVVDYDHGYLPFARAEFPMRTLFVARSVLLAHHFGVIAIPRSKNWKSRLRSLLRNSKVVYERDLRIQAAHKTVSEADLVNVSNEDDRNELIRCGIPAAKIAVNPFGISRERRKIFEEVSEAPPDSPTVAFVGTFDNRKGAVEFPEILRTIAAAVPDVRFRLVGTITPEQAVLARFPSELQQRIEVIPRFKPEELPGLLACCSVGLFPSYVEGFPFGVLEMTAAALPVIAYDAPGPPMMLPANHLVPRGKAQAMSAKVVALLRDEQALRSARSEARNRSRQFCWQQIAAETHQLYVTNLQQQRGCV